MTTQTAPAPGSSPIDIRDVDSAIRIVSINRPHRMNALDPPSATLLRDALRAAHITPGLRVVVITGTHEQFCAGADLRYKKAPGEDGVLERLQECHDAIASGPLPCIAAIEGSAYGAGLSLALACDRIVAGDGARLCAPFTGISLVPDVGMLYSLPRRVGWARAREWMIEGTVIDTALASRESLVDEVVAAGGALDSAVKRARVWAARAPLALSALKQLGADQTLAAHLFAQEREIQARLTASEDFAEAVSAFTARRPPKFQGC
ncbi:MAG: enoyl-CoA hydratase-related protein [Ottowia sp.]|uniref:enoyl-CoA hydratase/isomerase family protein n=1 Tax=Ottowia sp. TaxID=1898956 RepID=UPI003C784D98